MAGLQAPMPGLLLISDVLLLAYLLWGLAQRPIGKAARIGLVGLFLVVFLAWSFLATTLAGTSVTPLLRIAVYGAVFLILSRRGADRSLLYGMVVCYAVVNVVGGVLQGQTRLMGLDVGDPGQMGALLVAALCPLLTAELRFSGRWIIGAVLLYGIYLTQTRSVWFATIVVLVIWAQKKLSLSKVIVILLLLAALGLMAVDWVTQQFGLNEYSTYLRTQSVVNGIHNGLAHPLLGSGWGQVASMGHFQPLTSEAVDPVYPYNLLISVFTFVGVPGVLMLVLFFGGLLRHLVSRRQAPLLVTLDFLAHSVTEMSLYAASMQTLLFFIYAGIGLAPNGRTPQTTQDPHEDEAMGYPDVSGQGPNRVALNRKRGNRSGATQQALTTVPRGSRPDRAPVQEDHLRYSSRS
ncbi:O-antigen ligase family protein [Streptomyces sp. HUCO-GS316]|uniref:O-antigen ligase family protein n=1 Tax=Streptomyces sp. HUCO-GS316 TaxID=2692198 RepID=UPI001F22A261|nr:O-antigen ligase family protein [Streptomyces sp. HUCO-GS316]